jgi:hypothetical protein
LRNWLLRTQQSSCTKNGEQKKYIFVHGKSLFI